MTNSSSTAVQQDKLRTFLIKSLFVFTAMLLLGFGLWNSGVLSNDPYLEKTLQISGSAEKGGRIFKINCVACHGLKAQGLLGPDLHEVSFRMSEKKIIYQIIKGATPPMPRFQIEPENMADLLAYLETLH